MQEQSGHLTAQDLARYRVVEREPLMIAVGNANAHLNPLPAASGTLIAHTLAGLSFAETSHMARALRATGKARREVGGELARLIDVPVRQRGTTHISIIDAFGNACAVTVSNGEGNGELVGEFGFMLNNILGEEDVNPAGCGNWPVDARLASMMCPCLIETREGALAALGSGGSNRIRSAIAQVIMHFCLENMGLEQAVTAPRLHLEGDHLDFEDLFDTPVRNELCNSFPNHRAWDKPNMFFGGVHATCMDKRRSFSGVGDARRDGVAIVVG
jgi:gamma-glutamyltranspeptidase/glutathione hydrolase